MKVRQSGRGRAFVTLIQQLYFKTIRINVIIYRFSLVYKASRKRRRRIGNYHYGLNIEHAKPLIEKGLIVNSLLGDIPTATKQAARWGGDLAGFLI